MDYGMCEQCYNRDIEQLSSLNRDSKVFNMMTTTIKYMAITIELIPNKLFEQYGNTNTDCIHLYSDQIDITIKSDFFKPINDKQLQSTPQRCTIIFNASAVYLITSFILLYGHSEYSTICDSHRNIILRLIDNS
jgi:hypothetical protein